MVAVSVVRMMQVTVNEVVDVIAMRHGGVSATGTMNVIGRVSGTGMAAATCVGIGGRHGHRMFLHDAVGRLVVQVSVVEVVSVPVVLNGDMATAGTVNVIVMVVMRHESSFQARKLRATHHEPLVMIESRETSDSRFQSCSLPCASALAINSRTCPSANE